MKAFLSASILGSIFLTAGWAHALGQRLPDDGGQTLARPSGGESAATAQSLCQAISDRAKEQNVDVLIIGFEGLASFDSSGTRAAYQYRDALARNESPSVPGGGMGGYLLHGLIKPAIGEHHGRFEFLMFPHGSIGSGGTSAAEVCAKVWTSDADSRARARKLIITGHSYGGHAANQLADALDAAKVPVDYVLSVDPRLRMYAGRFLRPSNVKLWENFYQRNTPFLNGYVVEGADLNANLSSQGASHAGMPWMSDVQEALRAQLNENP